MKTFIEIGIYLVSIVLFIVATMFVQWEAFSPSEWTVAGRLAWLSMCLSISMLPVLGYQTTQIGKVKLKMEFDVPTIVLMSMFLMGMYGVLIKR